MKNIISLLLFISTLIGVSAAQDMQKLRVMTYNIHHGQGMDGRIDIARIGDIITDNKIDLAALQEVDRGVERTNKIDIMQMLSDQTGMFMAFGKNIDFQGGDYGNGVLSKFRLDSVNNLNYEMKREGEKRGLLKTIIKVNGERIVFIDTHTGDKNNESEKLMNADEIIAVLKGCGNMPVIMCGDFNDRPGSKMHEKLKEYFVDICELLGNDSGYSFPSVKPERRIDYIYISKEGLKRFKPLSITTIQTEASDHLPVIAEFEVSDNQ
ncbi:MAG: endonuclease/exonuclease/phosphatase family protein [Syntrophothermus sp.]